jgi:flagellar biosynthesis protein FlhF
MYLKKYHVRTMPEALARVKAELGPDAVIVAARQRRRFGLWGAPELEVTAGVEAGPPDAPASFPLVGSGKGAVAADRTATQPAPARPAAWAHGSQRARPAGAAVPRASAAEAAGRARMPLAAVESHGQPAAVVPEGAAGVVTLTAIEAMRRELGALRTSVERLANERALPTYREAVRALIRRLADHDLTPELAAQVGAAVERELSDAALADARALRDAVRREIERLVPTWDPLAEPGRHVLFLVGPTGVGKTTTLAKLAANFVLHGRGPVALITADTFRIAAIPQLRTYADIISVPLDVAYSPDDLRALIAAHQDKAAILIDTPGRSQHSAAQLGELRAFIRAAEPCVVLLTTACNVRQRDLLDVAERFSRVTYDGLIATKIDETRTYGAPLNLAHHIGVPLTYLTTGQNVPQDIEVATAGRLCDLLLSEHAPC